jgi:hypothetical protein
MTQEDLDLVVERTRHERYRWLVSEDNPDPGSREGSRAIVAELAAGFRGEPAPSYPPVAEQIGNALAAAGRFAASWFATVDRSEFERRRSICMGCPFMDKAQDRCTRCACFLAVKPWIKAESCPEGKWET